MDRRSSTGSLLRGTVRPSLDGQSSRRQIPPHSVASGRETVHGASYLHHRSETTGLVMLGETLCRDGNFAVRRLGHIPHPIASMISIVLSWQPFLCDVESCHKRYVSLRHSSYVERRAVPRQHAPVF